MVECGEKLRQLRHAKHLTQLQVAQRIGISKAMVSAYETDSKLPSIEVFIKLARLYGTTVDYLVCYDTPKYVDISDLDEESASIVTSLVDKLKRAQKEF